MMNRSWPAVSGLAIALIAISVPAQEAPAVVKRQKVVVIGASVSAGFEDPTSKQADGSVNRSFKLDLVFKKVWPRKVARVYNAANLLMFQDPVGGGQRQVDLAKKVEADLVVAVDFPFWFGYGFPSFDSVVKKGEISKPRMAVQQECFKMLDELKCPILIGDYPDMRGASTKMLPRHMIPNAATIAALNEKLHAYAGKRKNVHIVSLAKFVKRAVTVPQTYSYGDGEVVFPKNYLLQADRLHATRLGVVVITTHALSALPKMLKKDSPLLDHGATLKTLVKSMRLEDEIPQDKTGR
ncbi:MAG: hypothetical protein VX951_06650 [Planctomycetota bacterium]|nr:hypothetical protein [Planctomycetota bacterium]